MDEAGEAPENMEALKTAVMEKLSEWYMRNHGVGTMANVEDMCTLLQVHRSTSPPVFFFAGFVVLLPVCIFIFRVYICVCVCFLFPCFLPLCFCLSGLFVGWRLHVSALALAGGGEVG